MSGQEPPADLRHVRTIEGVPIDDLNRLMVTWVQTNDGDHGHMPMDEYPHRIVPITAESQDVERRRRRFRCRFNLPSVLPRNREHDRPRLPLVEGFNLRAEPC